MSNIWQEKNNEGDIVVDPIGDGSFSYYYTENPTESFEIRMKESVDFFEPKVAVAPDIANETLKPTSAVDLLETSAATLVRCGKKYDSTGNNSERVMDRIVDMFNAATGHELSEAQGNIFMVCLKVVRSETSTYHDDDHYIDGVNYFAMAGEASSKHYKDSV